MAGVLLALIVLLLAGCSDAVTQGDDLFRLHGDTIAAWDDTGYEDYTVRYSLRRAAGDEFRVVEITVEGGETVSCETEGDWAGLGLDPLDVCSGANANPVRFMLSLLGPVDTNHLEVSLHDDGYFFDRVTYDDPDRTGEERLITVLRLDAVPTRLVFWKQNGPEDYRIVYSRANLNGMGGSPGDGVFEVSVRDGRVVECVAQMNRRPSSQTECRPAVSDPISVLFSWLATLNPDHTDVTYHPEWRFPIEAYYDDPNSVDEETRIRVHSFEVVDDA